MIPLHRSFWKELDLLSDEIFTTAASRTAVQKFNTPPVRISETKETYLIEVLAGGRKKENFDITIEKNLLTIQSNEIRSESDETAKFIRNEFSLPSLKRVFTIDDSIDASQVLATYNDGILRIELRKKNEPVPEKQQITVI